MYNIISYEENNEFYISTLNNYLSEDLNSVKKDIDKI